MENTSDKSQFDSLLGGDVEIPQSVQIKTFVRARMDEIEALTQLIETPSTNILMKHKFPKHMRRRAMSQNVKRIPKRLREHQIDMREKSGVRELPIKRPRRKYRRRPQNLLSEYNRRQRKSVWLETHIWHAKRFHMIEKWGYKLANFPNDKSYRACYRATSKHSLIQDISYYCCLQLSGLLHELLEGLLNHTSTECGLTFESGCIQSGSYEGSVMFYSSGKYPYGAIGELNYIWRPSELPSQETRVLWLWCHPSFYPEVKEEIVTTFALEPESVEMQENVEPMDVDLSEFSSKKNSVVNEKDVEATKLETKNVPFIQTPKYRSSKSSVKLILLKDTLNRFRLTGPLSQALITSTFKEIDLSKRTVKDWCWGFREKKEICETQLGFWKTMKNISDPGQLPPRLVMGLIAADPRFTMPAHKSKPATTVSDLGLQSIQSVEQGLSFSPLWSSQVRDDVTKSKLSMHQLNEMRSNKLVPGLEVELNNEHINDLPAIPCLFIQRPGAHMEGKPLGYSSGFDVIVPAGFGQPVWLGLVMHGGRPGGLKETNSILREAGKLYLPPDTSAGRLEAKEKKNEETDKYFRLPPAKRHNYIKLGFQSPFHCPWKVLIYDWTNGEHDSFFVLRNRKKLLTLKNKLNKGDNFQYEITDMGALVGVMLTLRGKGNLVSNAYICIPSEEDLQKLKENPNFIGPVEKKHKDDLEDKRKEILEQHKKELRRLARTRHKQRKKGIEITENSKSDPLINQHSEEMKRLWLPDCSTIKDYGCRTVIGFVTEGDFSFTTAKSCGVGYVSLKGLINYCQLIEHFQKNRYVLVRNSNTNQYRYASISVICS